MKVYVCFLNLGDKTWIDHTAFTDKNDALERLKELIKDNNISTTENEWFIKELIVE